MIRLLERIGGKSAFGPTPKYQLKGISRDRFSAVLEKILQLANWRLEDAAISHTEVETLIGCSASLGAFLDSLQSLIADRFNIGDLGVEFPTLVIAVSSGAPGLRETARSLRRADSYYIEASRLLMYTRKSNVAEWWANRATSLTSALPHIIALFNAQLVCISASTVVHAALQSKNEILVSLVENVTSNKGNAKKIMSSSELHKFFSGAALDNREYGSAVKDDTYSSFDRIQAASETHHKVINRAIVELAQDTGFDVSDLRFEASLRPGLQSDTTYRSLSGGQIALEFHHKSTSETNQNKIAIYILEKLKEYAVNFGLGER